MMEIWKENKLGFDIDTFLFLFESYADSKNYWSLLGIEEYVTIKLSRLFDLSIL